MILDVSDRYKEFQSTPGISAGRYLAVIPAIFADLVSIHSRHFCREILVFSLAAAVLIVSFQSTPGISAGRYDRSGFRVHPSPVSIHSRHFCREILVRMGESGFHDGFQSTPGISAGRYTRRRRCRLPHCCFNPLPAFLPGDTVPASVRISIEPMFQSTPGISAGRYATTGGQFTIANMFQSTPGISAGRYIMARISQIELARFQSTPGISAGRYIESSSNESEFIAGFNPLPAFLPGDTRTVPKVATAPAPVSIHSRHFCREILSTTGQVGIGRRVSIHSRHFCREIRR